MTADRRTAFLQEIGVGPLWLRRDAPVRTEPQVEMAAAPASLPADAAPAVPALASPVLQKHEEFTATASPDRIAVMDWPQLKAEVAGCTKCGLCRNRTSTVFGVGDEKAKWLFVGEGPGRNEDQRGEPFVGPAGKLLDNMLLAMGLRRGENAYIANIVKCRPTDDNGRDRPPTPAEASACLPYLERQIALLAPTVLVALGKTAAVSLLGVDPQTPVSSLREKVHRHAGLPLIVTYHPAYLLRSPADKKKAWADLCMAMASYADAT